MALTRQQDRTHMLKPLSNTYLTQALQQLDGWVHEIETAHIRKEWVFDSFQTAMRFFVQVGELAEAADHHPELLSVYTKIVIRLTTHDANGLTHKDFDLAKQIDNTAKKMI
jgi:4a-hydroxytetrahydrobiopterin dehydratase